MWRLGSIGSVDLNSILLDDQTLLLQNLYKSILKQCNSGALWKANLNPRLL